MHIRTLIFFFFLPNHSFANCHMTFFTKHKLLLDEKMHLPLLLLDRYLQSNSHFVSKLLKLIDDKKVYFSLMLSDIFGFSTLHSLNFFLDYPVKTKYDLKHRFKEITK